MNFKSAFTTYLQRVEEGLRLHVPAVTTRPARLHEAMRYSLDAGGKRLRPVLALAAHDIFGQDQIDPLPAAIALECIHTYSLIHDDLPCMDDDDLRRGRPTAHKAFDEATALLAGDALLTHAFHLLATAYAKHPELATQLVAELGEAAGSRRLIGGQMADLLAEKQSTIDPEGLQFIHLNKTAAMIEASLVMGGLCGGAKAGQVDTLRETGRHIGLAFQIIDDILDVTATTETLGKTAKKDLKADKTTYVKLHGLDKARAIASAHSQEAVDRLSTLGEKSEFLRALVAEMNQRIK